MNLSDIVPEKTCIVRDGAFLSMGSQHTTASRQLVYVESEADLIRISRNPDISCVVAKPSLVSGIPGSVGIAVAGDPEALFFQLQSRVRTYPGFTNDPFPCHIDPSARIHPSAVISPASVSIGRDVVIEKNVIIHDQTIIEDGCIVRPNSVIGSIPVPGSQTIPSEEIVPSGGVHLCRDVDIHANCSVNRSLCKGFTQIGRETKIDNLSCIGQGTTIGKQCLLCGGVTTGGMVAVGNDAWVGPNTRLGSQIRIGNNVYVTIGSAVTQDIGDDKVITNNFAVDRKRFRKVIRGM